MINLPLTLNLCTNVHTLEYEWDAAKAESNKRKHGVRFSEATAVFQDEGAVLTPDPDSDEERYLLTGFDGAARLLLVVFTWRGPDTVRLISARKATRTEAKMYAEEQK
ncbi:MAG TPA: BrnT family toxin [Longimicrobiaceae bacterium]|nr:BrnT family toxin [Longimicrobiaceae bacterium]